MDERNLKKYWMTFRIGLHDRLVYRGNLLVTTCTRFIGLVTMYFLWQAIFAGSGRDRIASYTADTMIAYYILVQVARSFSSMPGLASGLAREVREGRINKYLLRPIDMPAYFLMLRAAQKVGYYVIAFVPFALLIVLLRKSFPSWPGPAHLLVVTVSLVNAFLIGFFFHFLIGSLALIYLEVSSFLFIIMVSEFFLNGHMFPIDLLPRPLWTVMQFLPFPYDTFYPVKMMMGHITGPAAWMIVLRQLAWVAILAMLGRWVLARGYRRYSAYGG